MVKEFLVGTVLDFKAVWDKYPNVLIWSGLLGIILFLI